MVSENFSDDGFCDLQCILNSGKYQAIPDDHILSFELLLDVAEQMFQ